MRSLLTAALLVAALLLPGRSDASPKIAVYGGTDGVSGTAHIANELAATGDFSSVTILNGSESTSALAGYTSILFYTNVGGDSSFADKMTTYVGNGGHLVDATFLQQANAMGGSNSLDTLAPLLPFTGYGGNYITQVSMVDNTPTDPLMQGVGSLSAFYHDNTSLSPGARLVASWSDGNPLVAVSSSGVIGINLFPNDAYGYVYGDYVQLFTNALGGVSQATVTGASGAVPEPSSLSLLAVGAGFIAARRRWRGRKAAHGSDSTILAR